jgi:hypothetical protein
MEFFMYNFIFFILYFKSLENIEDVKLCVPTNDIISFDLYLLVSIQCMKQRIIIKWSLKVQTNAKHKHFRIQCFHERLFSFRIKNNCLGIIVLCKDSLNNYI